MALLIFSQYAMYKDESLLSEILWHFKEDD